MGKDGPKPPKTLLKQWKLPENLLINPKKSDMWNVPQSVWYPCNQVMVTIWAAI